MTSSLLIFSISIYAKWNAVFKIIKNFKGYHNHTNYQIEYTNISDAGVKTQETTFVSFEDFSVMSLYLPSGTNLNRLEFKLNYMDEFLDYISLLNNEINNLIIAGDYNICHKALDILDPVRNKNISGFLPVEREWLQRFIDLGFIDSFREFNKEAHSYSWWTYRANARANNKGWRIDYIMASSYMKEKMKSARILKDVFHSDHCPISLTINN